MATACILMLIGAILVLNSGSCNARPRYEYSGEYIDDAENDLKGISTKNDVSPWNSKSNPHKGFKRVIPWPVEGHQPAERRFDASTTHQPSTKTTTASTHKPVLGRDRVLDQLHDYTGNKKPIYHSAVEGWIF
uniref:Secreted protein n=1 Tax=Lygus hesperus TaxID=30085 RepID=A0A146LGK9_LYGHE